MALKATSHDTLLTEALQLKDRVARLNALLVRVLDEDDAGGVDGISVELHTDIVKAVE